MEWNVDNYPTNNSLEYYKKMGENMFGIYSAQSHGTFITDFDNVLRGNPIV